MFYISNENLYRYKFLLFFRVFLRGLKAMNSRKLFVLFFIIIFFFCFRLKFGVFVVGLVGI